MEKQINEKIREVAQSVNETIPVAWDNLFINISLALMEERYIISLMKRGKMSISTIYIFQSGMVFLI